jgi:hypothetical protein
MTASLPSDVWEISLEAWAIQDGNYRDFHRGQVAEFALEFTGGALTPTNSDDRGARSLGNAMYALTAEIVFVTADVFVLDFGLQAFRLLAAPAPPHVQVGAVVAAADIALSVDPFFYAKGLRDTPGIPPLVYTWRIHQILLQTAPFVPAPNRAPGVTPVLIRDQAQIGWREIEQTRAWDDDNGHGWYLLQCALLATPPKHASVSVT